MKTILGIGMQSGGTTIISAQWFKRPDTDGVLDVRNDLFPLVKPLKSTEIFHQKLTFHNNMGYNMRTYEHFLKKKGHTDVKWYLILRNPLKIISSLKSKPYGDYWRVKLDNYRVHYKLAKDNDVPIVRYESFLKDPQAVMVNLFEDMGVPYQEFDINAEIQPKHTMKMVGNETFLRTQEVIKVDTQPMNLTEAEEQDIRERCKDILKEQYPRA